MQTKAVQPCLQPLFSWIAPRVASSLVVTALLSHLMFEEIWRLDLLTAHCVHYTNYWSLRFRPFFSPSPGVNWERNAADNMRPFLKFNHQNAWVTISQDVSIIIWLPPQPVTLRVWEAEQPSLIAWDVNCLFVIAAYLNFIIESGLYVFFICFHVAFSRK